jgi:hypothetical protein
LVRVEMGWGEILKRSLKDGRALTGAVVRESYMALAEIGRR